MKQIAFTKVNTAELLDVPRPALKPDTVCVRTCYSALSAGTERANVTGDPNCGGGRGQHGGRHTDQQFYKPLLPQ